MYIKSRQIFAFYNHWLMQYSSIQYKEIGVEGVSCEKINNSNIDLCKRQTIFPVSIMEGYLKKHSKFVDGFLFKKGDQDVVGFVWVMYKGGNESQYRVRHCDALVFDVYVDEKMRGKGLCGFMLSCIIKDLKEKRGVNTIRLSVRKNNYSAINAYIKNGWEIIGARKFVQFFRRKNIPYYSI